MLLILALGLASLALSALIASRVIFAEQRDCERAFAAAASYVHAERPKPRRHLSAAGVGAVAVAALSALWIRINPKASEDRMLVRLQNAGLSRRFSVRGFLAFQFLVGIALLAIGLALGHSVAQSLLLGVLFAVAGVYSVEFFLSRRAAQRAETVAAALPRVIDQVVISMDAGLSFDAALAHVISRGEGPLIDEFRIMLGEMKVGESRVRALRNLMARVPGEEVNTFVQAVIQSEQRGVSLTGILRAQADDLRHKRQLAAEEKAMKAPVKMLFPIVIFILPVIFVVILGPAFIHARGSGLFGG